MNFFFFNPMYISPKSLQRSRYRTNKATSRSTVVIHKSSKNRHSRLDGSGYSEVAVVQIEGEGKEDELYGYVSVA